MWPPFFLEYDLEGTRILLSDRFENSLIFDEIECACGVDHLAPNLECDQSGFEELLLEVGNFFHTLQVPVREDITSSECCSFSAAWCIEEDTIEDLCLSCEILSWIEGHSDIQTSHTIEVLQELRDAFTRGLIRDDETLRKILRELCRLSTWARCHIQYEKWLIRDLSIGEDMDWVSSSQFLDIKIAHQVVECIAESSLERIEVGNTIDLEAHCNIRFLQYIPIFFQVFLH